MFPWLTDRGRGSLVSGKEEVLESSRSELVRLNPVTYVT